MSNQNDLDDQLYILLASMKEYREAIADDNKRLEAFYKEVASGVLNKTEKHLKNANQKQIDAYFTMHDTLGLLLRKNRTATAEKNAVKKADMVLNPEVKNDSIKDERKQRDRENYFLGAYVKKLLDSSDFHKNSKEIQRIAFLFSTVEPEKKPKHIEIYQEAKNDPRNPFD